MSTHFLEIENFSDDETTAMFNAICKEVMDESPAEVKKNLLGMKDAKVNTKVSLTHLMLLIGHAELTFSFKVTYLKPDVETKKIDFEPAPGAIKEDVVFTAMQEQKTEVKEISNIFTKKLEEQQNALASPGKGKTATFDPGQLPDFNM